MESAFKTNAKIVVPMGSELVNVIGDMAAWRRSKNSRRREAGKREPPPLGNFVAPRSTSPLFGSCCHRLPPLACAVAYCLPHLACCLPPVACWPAAYGILRRTDYYARSDA